MNVPQESPATERRTNLKVRQIFEDAYKMIEPFFDPSTGWGGHSLEHLAFRVLRENFPQLSSEDVHTVIIAAHRVYGERHAGARSH